MTEHSIQWYLQQWGIWQRIAKNPIPRCVSPAYAIMKEHSIQWYLQQWGIWQRIAKNPIPALS